MVQRNTLKAYDLDIGKLVWELGGRFDKDDPSRAFSRLGPLASRFPHAVTVRFHLGLLLLWLGQFTQARQELALARKEAPRSIVGRQAQTLLTRLENVRTK